MNSVYRLGKCVRTEAYGDLLDWRSRFSFSVYANESNPNTQGESIIYDRSYFNVLESKVGTLKWILRDTGGLGKDTKSSGDVFMFVLYPVILLVGINVTGSEHNCV